MKYITILAFVCVSLKGAAQKDDSLNLYFLDEITITSNRGRKILQKTPEIVHVITSKDIEDLNIRTTGEILEYVSGINVETGTGSGLPERSVVSINGFSANYCLILIDGIRLLTEHIHTGQNIDFIPPENIERIEIIKGASSSQYGSDAMGGLINIITKKPTDKPESFFSFSGGSYHTYNTSVSLSNPINKKLGILIFNKYKQSSGISIKAPAHRVGNMGYSKFNSMNTVVWNINNKSTLSSSIFYTQNAMEFRDDDVYSKMFIPSLNFKHSLNNKLELTTRLKYSHWQAEQSTEINQLVHPECFINWNFTENDLLTFGGDYRYMNFSRTAVLEHDQQAMGLFAQSELEINRFSLLLACRFDIAENAEPVFSPKFAMMYSLLKNLRIRLSSGRGFHAPTVQELYEEGYGHGGRAYRFGNPDLQPEYSLTTTFSIEYLPYPNLQFFLNSYFSTIQDMITPVYSGIWAENPDTNTIIDKWVRTNIHEAKIYGEEFTIKYRINRKLFFTWGYCYTKNENVSTGGQLPYYPGESFYAKLVSDFNLFTKLTCSCYLSLRATKNRSVWNWKPAETSEYDNAEGLITDLKDYQLLNAGFKLVYNEQLNIHFHIHNVLGQDIEKLDDILTITDGQPSWNCGLLMVF